MAYLAAREVINISIPPRVEPVKKISIYLEKKKKKKRTPILINKEKKGELFLAYQIGPHL